MLLPINRGALLSVATLCASDSGRSSMPPTFPRSELLP